MVGFEPTTSRLAIEVTLFYATALHCFGDRCHLNASKGGNPILRLSGAPIPKLNSKIYSLPVLFDGGVLDGASGPPFCGAGTPGVRVLSVFVSDDGVVLSVTVRLASPSSCLLSGIIISL